MSTYKVVKYQPEYKLVWDAFVKHSKNATFLFHRDFMEYHQDRFEDYSLLVFKENNVVALLPANVTEHIVYSHQGLTYGGLILADGIEESLLENIQNEIFSYLKNDRAKYLVVKVLPEIYSSEAKHCLKIYSKNNNHVVENQNMVLAIDYNSDFKIHKTKLKRFKKLDSSFRIKEGRSELVNFWNALLVPRLKEKYQSKPVHSLSEIEYLQSKFKNEIVQYNIYKDESLLAGITIFIKGKTVKSQYGIASVEGEKNYALDILFVYLIEKFRNEGKQYFSMGTVNNSSELGYSKGMLKQKQEFGCRVYMQDVIKITVDD